MNIRTRHANMKVTFEVAEVSAEPLVLLGYSHSGKAILPRQVRAEWSRRWGDGNDSSFGWYLVSVDITGTVLGVRGQRTANDATRGALLRSGPDPEWHENVPKEIRDFVMRQAPGPLVYHA